MHSIRFKITALTVTAILISIVVLGGIGVLAISAESDRSSAEKMQLIAEDTKRLLDGYLNSLQQSVDMAIHIAGDNTEGLDPAILHDYNRTPVQQQALDDAMAEHCAHVERAFSSIAQGTSGIVTYYYCINAKLGSNEHGFFLSRLGTEEFERQAPLNSDELDPADIEHTTWYYSPIAAGQPVWIGPYLAHFLGERWTVSYVAPIYSGDELLGVLGMDILFDTMIEQISSWTFYNTGYVALLDAEGRILYHPTMALGDKPELISDMFDETFFRGESSNGEMIRYTVDGEARQLAFCTLSNGMKAVVVAPVREITAFQRQITTSLIIATAVLLAVFAAITVVSVENITEPLLQLADASKKLAAGDYSAELPKVGKDEVGVLTESFGQMRDQLKLHISDLNSRAYSDALTGVKNKGALDVYSEQLDAAIQTGGAESPPEFAFVMFDCNRLKQINDVHGHEKGDVYLKTASRLICRVFQHSPVFRIGGDEFAVLLQGQDYADRIPLLRRFDDAVAENNAAARAPWETVSLSRGMSEFRPDSDRNAWQVLHRADEMMYEDKRYFKQSSAE